MITQVKAEGFKGQTFVQDLDESTLLIGPNGTGKSARTQALILALQGAIPGSGKTNAEILENFGTGDKLVVGFKIGVDYFERGIVRTEKGVSQGFKHNSKKVSKDVFMHYVSNAGRPVAVDIAAFMDLSDQKKIDYIFDLYPTGSEINQVAADIEKAKDRLRTLTKAADDAEAGAARLASSRACMNLPTGSLPELQAQEKLLQDQLTNAQAELGQAQVAEARTQEVAKSRKEQLLALGHQYPFNDLGELSDEKWSALYKTHKDAWDKKQKDDFLEELRQQAPQPDPPQAAPATQAAPIQTAAPATQAAPVSRQQAPVETKTEHIGDEGARQSIQAILNALNAAGCGACAARLVALRELNKYRRVAA